MANVKITQLAADTNPASDDVLPFVDISSDETKKVTIADLLENAGDGSASGAAFGFDADPDTGMYRTGTNALAFTTGGTGRLFIDSSGNCGIGTTDIDGQLEVRSSTAAGIISRSTSTQSTNSNKAYRARNNSDTDTFNISYKGQGYFSDSLGVGTSSPGSKLEVNGDIGIGRVAGGYTFREVVGGSERAGIHSSATNALVFKVGSASDAASFDASGRLLVGTSSSVGDDNNLQVVGSTADGSAATFWRSSTDAGNPAINFVKTRGSVASPSIVSSDDILGHIRFNGHDGTDHNSRAAEIKAEVDGTPGANDMPGRLVFSTTPDSASAPTERMRITQGGVMRFGQTTSDTPAASNVAGAAIGPDSYLSICRASDLAVEVGRKTNDGNLMRFLQDGTVEGGIVVSGTTVSYVGGHLARWSQLASGAERTEILRGSVLSNIDEMCEWGEEDNEQLNRMQVSDVEGDPNVAGVFQAWDDDDDTYTNDFYCAMTGDFVIRIAQGTTVARGDLLMSAGDGTAKPQDDDIIRSKTIAKVTSTTVLTTYADGSYCVPCVLMAC